MARLRNPQLNRQYGARMVWLSLNWSLVSNSTGELEHSEFEKSWILQKRSWPTVQEFHVGFFKRVKLNPSRLNSTVLAAKHQFFHRKITGIALPVARRGGMSQALATW